MESIVQHIICSQFESTFGGSRLDKKATVQTFTGREVTVDTNSDPNHAMQVTFSLNPNYDVEDGYRHLTLLIFGGGTNYIAVYAKTDWNVIRNEWSDGDNLEPGKDYIKGETPWVSYGYHDSGWREAVGNVIREFHGRVSHINTQFNGQTGWYKNVQLTDEQIEELKSIRNARYEGRGPWVWKKASELEFHFEVKCPLCSKGGYAVCSEHNPNWERDNCSSCHGERGGVKGNENIVDGKILCDYCTVDSADKGAASGNS